MMSARKPHRKSRTGCVPCKKRHVKCGEEKPKCVNCSEYEVDCHYLPVTSVSLKDSLRSRSSSHSSSSLPKDPLGTGNATGIGVSSNPGNDELDVSDLELLHFFSTVTYATMSTVAVEQDLWRTTIVTIGLQHTFLLRALLAQAAAHLSCLKSSSESVNYLIKASTHQNIAIAQFRKALETIDASNFDAVLAFSCLLPVHSLTLAACATARPERNEQDHILSEFLKAIRLLRSVNSLLLPSLSVYTSSPILPLLQVASQHLPVAENYPGQESIGFLDTVCCRNNVAEHNAAFSDTIKELRLTFSRAACPPDTERFTLGIILLFTVIVPEEFVILANSRVPEAMVILAHYATLFCEHDDTWWLRGLGTNMVDIINQELGDEWRHAMEWPNEVAERVRRERDGR
ncbi:uncharacterized protein LY89DRAFT_725519 [Mollisia scopiformis]|uniref:Zn(2)-C6 fungal-type domain-containing protein n=1 Tax=Mollisia scopiformis TaxID=149040 RepID=A0A132B5S7_MOLSC|nr:uncharacterized protein LY89DRAFT_725519 [Mollisia scopiformis]KUJ07765.1 hypothetical protein LY89DRAFT_725519 [Mollisia scopiformis]